MTQSYGANATEVVENFNAPSRCSHILICGAVPKMVGNCYLKTATVNIDCVARSQLFER